MRLSALLVFAAVLAAGCVQQPSPSDGQPGGQTPAAGNVVNVVATDAGFSPASVTVNAGDTVVWANNGDRPAWPASDDHPTHTKLPGFDSLRGLAKGETYSYRFTRQGTWGYHDHLRPALAGSVTVGQRV